MSRKICLCLLILLLGPAALSRISTGVPTFEDRFAKADLVCVCRVLAAQPVRAHPSDELPLGYKISEVALKTYKGGVAGRVYSVSYSPLDPLSATAQSIRGDSLLFLNADNNQGYKLADADGSSTPSNGLERGPGTMGALGVQKDIVASLNGARNGTTALVMLRLLVQFDNYEPATLDSVEAAKGRFKENSVFVTSATISIRGSRNVARNIDLLASSLDSGGLADNDLTTADSVLYLHASAENLPSLIQLAHSGNRALRFSAMNTMRRLRLPGAIPFWIESLKSADSFSQYTAVISLAEITGKYGNYAPNMGDFEANPAHYTQLWQKWAEDQRPPASKKP